MRIAMVFVVTLLAGCQPASEPPSRPTAQPSAVTPKRLPRDMLGVTLAAEISTVPQCSVRNGVEIGFWEQPVLPCVKKHGATAAELRDGVRLGIKFHPDKMPPGVKDAGDVLVIDNVIQTIELNTDGNDSQLAIQELLEKKFGPPDEKSVERSGNAMGASFPNIVAGWSDGVTTLYHFGMLSRIDEGVVHLETAEAKVWRERRETESKREF